jgi:alkylation response protein AidB-like acyl-CoA dehydrogenase
MGGIIGAQCLGIARGAIDAFVELAAGKRPVFGQDLLRDRGTVQAKVARAEALVRSARLFLFDTYRMRDEWALSGQRTEEQRALGQLAVVNAGDAAAEAVDLVYLAAGSSAVYRGSKLERTFRDIHTLTQHAGASHLGYEQVGRHFLGLGLSPVR